MTKFGISKNLVAFVNRKITKGICVLMGIISKSAHSANHNTKAKSPFTARSGRGIWAEVFGRNATDKEQERQLTVEERQQEITNSYGRSAIYTNPAVKRLLEALRTQAPGGWTDDRYEQTLRHFTGVQYVAISRICTYLEQAEFKLYIKDPRVQDGKREITEADEEYALINLLEKPNPHDGFGDLMYRWGQQILLTGTALTWMIPNQLMEPMELYAIPTAMAVPQPVVNPEFPQGYYRIQPLYPYGPFSTYPTPQSSAGAAVGAQWFMRFQFPHPLLQYEGYSPLTGLRSHIDGVESIDRSRWYAMKRGINPSAVLNFDNFDNAQPLSEEDIERIRADFEGELQGTENTGKLFVAHPGSKLEQWGSSPVDMDFQGGWDQLVGFVMGGLGITKPAAGMVEDSSYATLYATIKQLYVTTTQPLCDKFARKLTRHLAPFFGKRLILEIRCKRIDDEELRNSVLQILTANKACTINELRKGLDWPMVEEEWGNERCGEQEQKEQQATPGGQPQPEQPQEQGEVIEGLPDVFQPKKPEEEKAVPTEIASNQPKAGKLAEGSKGPVNRIGKRFNGIPLNGKNGVH